MAQIVTSKPPEVSPIDFLKQRIKQSSNLYAFTVLEAEQIGNVVYAAIQRVDPVLKDEVIQGYAIVCTESKLIDSQCNFAYEIIHEEEGPYAVQCPLLILDMLTDTRNQTALTWRNACRTYNVKRLDQQAKLADLRNGDCVQFVPPLTVREQGSFSVMTLIDRDRWIFVDADSEVRVQIRLDQLLDCPFELLPCF